MNRYHLLYDMNFDRLIVPLTYIASTVEIPFSNLGDALSPIIVSALSGLPCEHTHLDSTKIRMAAVGSIGHCCNNGAIHFWGTGVDNRGKLARLEQSSYKKPDNTSFFIHALRGPVSRKIFQNAGIDCPTVYGDPVWFIPDIIPEAQEKKYELGVIIHISETETCTPLSAPKKEFARYIVNAEDSNFIKIINTWCDPSFKSIEDKIQEITACRRIVSTSFHGLVIAEAFRIPCLYYSTKDGFLHLVNLMNADVMIDQRFRDFYVGVGKKSLLVYGQQRHLASDWNAVIAAIDRAWEPLNWDAQDFLDAFPLPLSFNPLKKEIFINRRSLEKNRY